MSDEVAQVFRVPASLALPRFWLSSGAFLLASLSQYHFGLLLALYIAVVALSHRFGSVSSIYYLPNLIRNRSRCLFILSISLLSPFLAVSQNILARFWLHISPENSSAITRMGLDAPGSLHYGGFLSVLQFLGGNRISVCAANLSGIGSSSIDSLIAPYNCILSIISLFLLASFVLYRVACRIVNPLSSGSWLFSILTIPFILMGVLFQQSFAVHLQGYSIIFSAIFSLGFTFLVVPLLFRAKDLLFSLLLFTPIIYLPVFYTFVKVSYLTPAGG